MASITPEMDGQRPNTGIARSLTEDKTKDATFKPVLISSPTKRNKVQSSGYGTVVPKVPKREPAPPPEEASPELTFKPDLSMTKKVRNAVTATGYGKVTPGKRIVSRVEEPSFKPDLSLTARARKAVTSTGYGKNAVVPKKSDEDAYRPSFQPNMNFSKRSTIMRKQVASRLLDERPRTAPAGRREETPRSPLLHTLAADRSNEQTTELSIEGPDFVLDGCALANTPAALSKSLIDLAPPPVKHNKHGEGILQQATATGYGSSWAPEVSYTEAKPAKPVLHFGKQADTYIIDSSELPVFKNKNTDRVVANYARGQYSPPVVQIERPKTADRADKYYSSPRDHLPGIEDLPVVKNKLDHVASSGYGIVSPSGYNTVPVTKEKSGGETVPEPTVENIENNSDDAVEEQTTIL